MIRHGLLASITLITAVCFACMPNPNPPQPIQPVSSCAFSRITVLPASFDPSQPPDDPGINDPPASSTVPPANVQNDLNAAFAIAPAFFKSQLCGLDGIYITAGPEPWGYRNRDNGHRFIALPMSLWAGSGPAQNLSEYENGVVRRLLRGWTGPKHVPGNNNPANTSAMAVLAALAHEFGHVLFYDTFVSPPGSAPHYENFCGGTFFADSWQALPAPPIWRQFGTPTGQHKADDMQTTTLYNLVPPPAGDPRGAAAMLLRIYSLTGTGQPTGRWAGLFASFSPDEDFVETFKFFVLRNAATPLQSMGVQVPVNGVVASQNIPASCSQRPVLVKKLSCFAQKFCTSQPSPDACSPCQ